MLGAIFKIIVGTVAVGKVAGNGLQCLLGHKWNGCKCEVCGAVRDEHHRMVSVPEQCTQQCAICGKTGGTHHNYKKDQNTSDYICVVCGMNKKDKKEEDKALLYLGGMLGILLLVGGVSWLAEKHWNFLMVLIVLIMVAVITAIVLWFRHLKRQQDIEILKANISRIGEDEAARRAKKYFD